jgi:hypothetical protein
MRPVPAQELEMLHKYSGRSGAYVQRPFIGSSRDAETNFSLDHGRTSLIDGFLHTTLPFDRSQAAPQKDEHARHAQK